MKKGLFAFLLTFMLGIFTVLAQVENRLNGHILRRVWEIMNTNLFLRPL